MNKEIFETMQKMSNDGEPVWKVIDYAKEKLKWIPRPAKPMLKTSKIGPTSEEALQYANELKAYEEAIATYKIEEERIRKENGEIYSAMDEFIKQEADFYSIPEQYQSKIFSLAYEQGHSSGHSEIFNYLLDLVAIFK